MKDDLSGHIGTSLLVIVFCLSLIHIFGNFVIRTNVVQDPFIARSIYRARNIVEQSFQQFKNQTAGDRLYATSSTYMGKLFVQVLAQSLRLMMRMACRRNETATNRLPSNSLTKAFMQLRYLKEMCIRDRSTAIAIAGIRKRNSHALRNDAMSGVWIRKLGRSISGANSSRITRNTPASFGFTDVYKRQRT